MRLKQPLPIDRPRENWARYTARFGDPGSVRTWKGIDAFTLMRHEGRWRIVSLAYTDVPE